MKRLLILMLTLALMSLPAFADAADAGRSLTVRTFQFKHKQADLAASAIKSLLSTEGSMAIQPAANSLVVTDAPENIKRIAAALAQFDAPAQPLQLSIRLVSASRAAADAGRVDASLKDVASKLALLRYNVLDVAGSADVTGSEGEAGLVDLGAYRADFRFGEYDPATDSVKLSDFKLLRLEGDQLTPILKTTLNLTVGQTVIIGATKQPQSQRALMIVVTAKR